MSTMKILLISLLLITGNALIAQQKKTHDFTHIDTTKWVIPNTDGLSYSLSTYKGSKALIIKKNFNNYKYGGVAYPKGLNFSDGEIELDMASSTGKEYLGLAFLIKDAHHYETLYFRPESGEPSMLY